MLLVLSGVGGYDLGLKGRLDIFGEVNDGRVVVAEDGRLVVSCTLSRALATLPTYRLLFVTLHIEE